MAKGNSNKPSQPIQKPAKPQIVPQKGGALEANRGNNLVKGDQTNKINIVDTQTGSGNPKKS